MTSYDSLMTFSTKYDTICWVLVHHLDQTISKQNDSFRNSEWGPEAAEAMCNEVRDFAIPGGPNNDMVLGDLIDKTPKELISKVMLEEKVFDTWCHGRIALLGDGKPRESDVNVFQNVGELRHELTAS